MSKFNWTEFVNDVEVIRDSKTPEKVDHLCYFNIEIHHSGKYVGAYKFSKESREDNELIIFFENNSVILTAIIKMIEYGLSASVEDSIPSLDFNSYNCDPEALRKAFEKGRALQLQRNF